MRAYLTPALTSDSQGPHLLLLVPPVVLHRHSSCTATNGPSSPHSTCLGAQPKTCALPATRATQQALPQGTGWCSRPVPWTGSSATAAQSTGRCGRATTTTCWHRKRCVTHLLARITHTRARAPDSMPARVASIGLHRRGFRDCAHRLSHPVVQHTYVRSAESHAWNIPMQPPQRATD